jgi:hypothetical protein
MLQYQGSGRHVPGGTPSVSNTIKEAVFYTFDLTYLPCCLQTPDISCVEGGSLKGRKQHYFDAQHGISKRLLAELQAGISLQEAATTVAATGRKE